MWIYVRTCAFVCMYGGVHVCKCACMCACMGEEKGRQPQTASTALANCMDNMGTLHCFHHWLVQLTCFLLLIYILNPPKFLLVLQKVELCLQPVANLVLLSKG